MGRPKIPIISAQGVIDAALEMIDEDGLENFNLRRLSLRLGVNNGSLYYHYRYKKDIFRDVLLYALRPISLSPEPVEDWKAYIVDRTVTLVSVLVKHPNLTPLLSMLAPRDYGLAVEDQSMRVMLEAGVPPKYAILIREQIEAVMLGSLMNSYGPPLFDDVPADRPHLAAAVAARAEFSAVERAEMAARAIVDGIGQRAVQDATV